MVYYWHRWLHACAHTHTHYTQARTHTTHARIRTHTRNIAMCATAVITISIAVKGHGKRRRTEAFKPQECLLEGKQFIVDSMKTSYALPTSVHVCIHINENSHEKAKSKAFH